MNKITIAGLKFQMVKAGSVFIGEDRGGWIYSGQRPKHEVRCPDFYIMEAPMTLPELANILEAKLAPEDETTWNKERLTAILAIVNQTLIDSNVDLDSSLDWEIRCPTQGEWLHAKNTKKIEVECGMKEVLADAVAPNYRGAMMDGRPRQFDGHGPMQWHTATMEIHPNKASIHALSSAPMDRDNIGLSVRLVLTPIRKG
ncbi:MAG: hypothetical protein VXY53_00535 [Candidatus Thermoplasmatota archaeon]|nr:hypothetical protein [Candidatus Thermoplasmatota archaeon]